MTEASAGNGSGSSPEMFCTDGATTRHTLELKSGELSYRAIAEWTTLRKIHKPVAHVFHTAYLADSDGDRPLTFVFNGGPGAASAYLHMGALGPRRVAFGDDGALPAPPVTVVDNLESWLAFTDLVFIDPVGTGFSRAIRDSWDEGKTKDGGDAQPAEPAENADYWEINTDLDALGEFIRRFLSQHHRWTSPLFIAGESYGGFRVAKMARSLQETHGIGLCGALLISPAIEFEGLFGSDYNLTYWTEVFPSLVASAFQHGLCRNLPDGTDVDRVLQLGESFATGELTQWLARGDALTADERAALVTRFADLTGLPESVVERAGGRVNARKFCRELLREQRRVSGMYDASLSTVDPFPDRDSFEGPDPSLAGLDRIFTGAINHQLRNTLQVDSELDYRLLSMDVFLKWKDKTGEHVFRQLAGAMDDLRYGMSLNPHMRVMIAHGWFDLVTPYFASGRQIGLMKLTDEQAEMLETRNYNGGHMFYSWNESRRQFCADAEDFYERSVPGGA